MARVAGPQFTRSSFARALGQQPRASCGPCLPRSQTQRKMYAGLLAVFDTAHHAAAVTAPAI